MKSAKVEINKKRYGNYTTGKEYTTINNCLDPCDVYDEGFNNCIDQIRHNVGMEDK